jgi:hypothetical protein
VLKQTLQCNLVHYHILRAPHRRHVFNTRALTQRSVEVDMCSTPGP